VRCVFVAVILVLGSFYGCAERATFRLDGATSDSPVVTDTPVAPDAPRPNYGACADGRGECNRITNIGCAEGQWCSIMESGSSCQSAAGMRAWGTRCDSPSECRPGYACVGGVGGSVGYCMKLCCVGEDLSCQDQTTGGTRASRCITIDLGISNATWLGGCVETECDPLLEMNNGCSPFAPYCDEQRGDAGTERICRRQGGSQPSPRGGSCVYNTDCVLGYRCAAATGGPRLCYRRCDTSAPQCPTGETCRPLAVGGAICAP
jgi:hypothetical protein